MLNEQSLLSPRGSECKGKTEAICEEMHCDAPLKFLKFTCQELALGLLSYNLSHILLYSVLLR